MPVVASLIGIIPPVVMAGAAIKITKGALGSPAARRRTKVTSRRKSNYPKSKYSPF